MTRKSSLYPLLRILSHSYLKGRHLCVGDVVLRAPELQSSTVSSVASEASNSSPMLSMNGSVDTISSTCVISSSTDAGRSHLSAEHEVCRIRDLQTEDGCTLTMQRLLKLSQVAAVQLAGGNALCRADRRSCTRGFAYDGRCRHDASLAKATWVAQMLRLA